MNICPWSTFPKWLIPLIGIILFSVCFWPMAGLGHPAGELYEKAVQAVENKNFQQAETLLQQAVSEFPSFAEAHHLLGLVQYQHTNDPKMAIPALKEAVKLNTNFSQAFYDLGLLLLHQKQFGEAQEAIQQSLTLYPRFWEARLTLAKSFDQTGATDKAIQEYETVLSQEPYASEALFNLAYHMMQKNQADRAKDLLTQLTTHDSQHSEGWYLLGRLFETDQQFDQAIGAYQQVLQSNPDHADAHYNLGFLFQQGNQRQKAVKHFQRVTELNPDDPEAYFNLGVILVTEEQLNQAEKAYQKGIALQPNSVEGHFNIGAFYEFHKENLAQAKTHYQKYIDLGGKDLRIKQLFHE